MSKNNKKELQKGDKIQMFTILSLSHQDEKSRRYYNVRCECGTVKVILGSHITSGSTKSCGCYGMEVRKNKRLANNYSEVTAIILGYKRHAKSREINWSLERKEVEKIIRENCFYCDIPPSNIKKTKNSIEGGLKYSGIDRINSNLGYVINNVVPCCSTCNHAKKDLSFLDFKNWALRLGENIKKIYL